MNDLAFGATLLAGFPALIVAMVVEATAVPAAGTPVRVAVASPMALQLAQRAADVRCLALAQGATLAR